MNSEQSDKSHVHQVSSRSRHHGRAVLNVSQAQFSVPITHWGRTMGEKHIVKGVSVSMNSGETLAVMGPSGAGKTTFMDLLTLEGAGGRRIGHVDLNGAPITPAVFKKHCSYVPQHDSGWPFLSCRESLQFAADLYMTSGAAERKRRVEELIKTMGLESCQNTRVGNEFLKGLSGGQKRRLSLAVAFLKDPLVVFLDEVTSGLDAAAAAGVAKFLQDLAHSQDVIIVCTIHQPSAKIFKGFDKLLLLSSGSVAYSGRVKDAPKYFESLGYRIPDQENPADFLLDSVNSDFADKDRVQELLTAWENRLPEMCKSGTFEVDLIAHQRSQNALVQTCILFRRLLVLAMRDPTVYLSRVVVFFVACSFFTIVYIKSRDRTQDQVFNRLWLILWHLAVPSAMSLVACLGQNLEFVCVQREVKSGMYKLSTYFLAQFLIQVPFLIILSLSAISLGGYGLANWNGDVFGQVLVIHVLFLLSFESAAQLFAVAFKHPMLGLLNVVSWWFTCFLFGGFLVPEADVPWPLRACTYISPIKFATKAIIFAELHGTKWEGAVLDSSNPRGFACPGGSAECWGATGDQVLESMGSTAWKNLSTEDEFAKDCCMLLAIAAAFKLLYIIVACVRCRGGNVVIVPKASHQLPLPRALWAQQSQAA